MSALSAQSRLRRIRIPQVACHLAAIAATTALIASACGGGSSSSSGLATLVGSTPVDSTPATSSAAAGDADTGPATASGLGSELSASGPSEENGAADAPVGGAPATDAPTAGTQASGAGSDPELTDEEALLAFAQCMRDNGVEFPDPVVEADGTVTFGLRLGPQPGGSNDALGQIGRDSDLPAARRTCSGLLEGRALGPGGADLDEAQIERSDQLLAFAQCMRDNGIDMADPDPNAFGRGAGGARPGGPFGEIDFDDAETAAALEVCSAELPGFAGGRARQ